MEGYDESRNLTGNRSPVASRAAVIYGAIGTATVFVVGPILYWVTGLTTGSWTSMGMLFTGVYGPMGIFLGSMALRKLKTAALANVAVGRILGILSIVGGSMASFFCAFFLLLFGFIAAYN